MIEKSTDNVKNVITSINHIASFIDKRDLKNHEETNFLYLGQVIWDLLLAIYKRNWDKLKIDNKNQLFRQNILA